MWDFFCPDSWGLGMQCRLSAFKSSTPTPNLLFNAAYNAAALAQDVQSPETDLPNDLLWQTTQVRTGITGLTSKP